MERPSQFKCRKQANGVGFDNLRNMTHTPSRNYGGKNGKIKLKMKFKGLPCKPQSRSVIPTCTRKLFFFDVYKLLFSLFFLSSQGGP